MMEQFIGVKMINAVAMTRLEYNQFRGWELPEDENGDDDCYLVEYVDGGQANTEEYDGYVSWSPADVFDRASRSTRAMSFGLAIEAAKKGALIARAGWNGKSKFVYFKHYPSQPYLVMKTAQDQLVPWLASQSDMLDDDGEIVG